MEEIAAYEPECLQQSPQQCHEIRINTRVPIQWALPLYGFLMPLIVAITILTNSFIVIVLSHRSLRTPTNYVLGAMAITELLTGLLGLPWLLYYYTFDGYRTDEWEGLPSFWCTYFPYMATTLPSIFHTAASWLTVYLAVQRYIYICVPKLVQILCTIRRSKQMIVFICMVSLAIYAPDIFASYNQSYRTVDASTNRTRSKCVVYRTTLVKLVGDNLYYMLMYAVQTIVVHTLPCVLLVFFTWCLIAAIREADKKHCNLIRKKSQQQHGQPQHHYDQRKTTVGTMDGRSSPLTTTTTASAGRQCCATTTDYCNNNTNTNGTTPSCRGTNATAAAFGQRVAVPTMDMPTISNGDGNTTLSSSSSSCCTHMHKSSHPQQQQQQQQRGSFSESKRVQGIRQNTRMLLAVILLFLVTEIPAALIFSMHVGAVALNFTFLQPQHYAILNKLLIVRNVLIVVSYPLRFAIYCGMSAQFREVVKQMLAKWKMLFQHFSYGKLGGKCVDGCGGGMRRVGSGRRSEEMERSTISAAQKNSTSTMGMFLQKDTVIWRNGVGAIGGNNCGERDDEMVTTKLITDSAASDGRGGLGRHITTVNTIGEDKEEEERYNDSDEEEEEEKDDETDECKL